MYPLSTVILTSVIAGLVAGIFVLVLSSLVDWATFWLYRWYYDRQYKRSMERHATGREQFKQEVARRQAGQHSQPAPSRIPRASPLAHVTPDTPDPDDEIERDRSRREKRTFWS